MTILTRNIVLTILAGIALMVATFMVAADPLRIALLLVQGTCVVVLCWLLAQQPEVR